MKKELKLARDLQNETRIKNVSATDFTNYSLWKEIKHVKSPPFRKEPLRADTGKWLQTDQDKVNAFQRHLNIVFTPNNFNDNSTDITSIQKYINSPLPVTWDIPKLLFKNKIIK